MGMKRKAIKNKHDATETTSSGGENMSIEDEWPLNPLQDAQCNGTIKNFVYLFDNSSIKLVREPDVTVAAEDKLEGATMVPPPHKQDYIEGGQAAVQDW